MMARRVEQVTAVRRVNIEKYTRDDDSLLFEQFLEERLSNIGVR
jgi:hypothetical protein